MNFLTRPQAEENEEHWISVSDLMAGLMIVFLFISIALILENENNKTDLEKDGAELREFEAKQRELENALAKLEKEIGSDVIEVEGRRIRFKDITTLFKEEEYELTTDFKNKLNRLIPLFLKKMKKFECYIDEIRIEGHASPEWKNARNEFINGKKTAHVIKTYSDDDLAYLRNMILSQNRARMVLDYFLFGNAIGKDREWVEPILTANGYSSSKKVANSNEKSRRVEIVVLMKRCQ